MTTTDRYAVFGHPINHSKSPRIHQLFAQQTQQNLSYTAQDVPTETFGTAVTDFFAHGGKGLNCTVPLKELAWQFADQLTDKAQRGKAVNTLALQADGSILGDNTDGIGLVRDLTCNHAIALKNQKILILGAGGATRGILAPILEQNPHQVLLANRTISKAKLIENEFIGMGPIQSCEFGELPGLQFDLIINATSASLSGDLPPLPDSILTANGCCYDLAYSNQPTSFVDWGSVQGANKSLDGLGMLVEQAAEAFYIWRGIRPETTTIISQLNRERLSNINSLDH